MAAAGMPHEAYEQIVVASALPSTRRARSGERKRVMSPVRRLADRADLGDEADDDRRRRRLGSVVSHTPLRQWLDTHTGVHKGAHGARLWECIENYYVKTFSGWMGTDAEVVRGISATDFERAKATLLKDGFTVLLTEAR